MADKPAKTTTKTATKTAGAQLAERLAKLPAAGHSAEAKRPARQRPARQAPAEPAQPDDSTPAQPARRATRNTGRGRTPMPPEQPKPGAFYSARISHTATPEQKKALELARVEDGIEATARIRAMTQLWMEDERLRARVDKLARTLR